MTAADDARSAGSGRDFTGDLNIIDEAFALTNEQTEALAGKLAALSSVAEQFNATHVGAQVPAPKPVDATPGPAAAGVIGG